MMYFILLIGIICTSGLCKERVKIKLVKSISGKDVYIFIWGLILVLLVALRSTEIGNDTHMYEYIFNSMKNHRSYFTWMTENTYTSGTEHGYYLLCFLLSRFADYRIFLIFTAFATVTPFIYLIRKYSPNVPLSFLLYICFPYYTFNMSGLRQSYALAFIAIAYIFIKEKKLIRYIITCTVATLFHSSALLFLPIYWVARLKNNKKTRLIFIVAIVASYLLKNQIWQVATLFARQQYSSNDAGGQMMCLFMILSALLGIYYRKSFLEPRLQEGVDSEKELFYLQIFAALIVPLATINSAVSRIYYYYHIFVILYVPVLVASIKRIHERYIIIACYAFVAVYFLVSIVMNPIQNYNPYRFMWQ